MSVTSISAQELRQFIEKLERLEDEKAETQNQIKEIMAESKASGFDPKIIRKIIGMRKMKKEDLIEQEELLDIYAQALGMRTSL